MVGQRKAPSALDSRERILASAAARFATFGFRKSTFEEIASGAGVSRTLLYTHFANKVDLLRAVRDRALAEWAESVEQEVARCRTARDALEALIGETLRFAHAHPVFRAFLSGDSRLALHGEPGAEDLSRDEWRQQIVAMLRRGMKAGEFAPDLNARASAQVMCAMQLGVIDQMHGDDAAVAFGTAHVVAATRIIVGGVVHPLKVPAGSGAIA